MFEQIQHKRVYEEVVDIMIERIRSGNLEVGEKLPAERIMAEEMGVSRASLREALRVMESIGYIRSTTGGGNYINKVTLAHVLPPFTAILAQDKKMAADTIEVRRHLEVHIAELAAKNATREQISRIYGTILAMQAEIEGGGNGIESDNRFHHEIAKASGNRAFAMIAELCYELLAESRKATLDIPGQPAKTVEDHLSIFEAVRKGDGKSAAREMDRHLAKAQTNIEKHEI